MTIDNTCVATSPRIPSALKTHPSYRALVAALRDYTQAVLTLAEKPKPKRPKPDHARLEPLAVEAVAKGIDNVSGLANVLGLTCRATTSLFWSMHRRGLISYRGGRAHLVTAPQKDRSTAPRMALQIANVRRVLADGRTMASRELYQAAGIPQGSWPTVRDYMIRKGILVASDISNGKGFNFRLAPSELRASIKPEETTT